MSKKRVLIPVVFGLGVVAALLGMLSGQQSPVAAAPTTDTRYVATTGTDSGNDCSTQSTPCRTIQQAVDLANPGDTIKVATGTYTDVHVRPRNDITTTGVVTQVVYVSETITLRGGYATTDWATPDPEANPTTLDAQGQGRVLNITGDVSPTIEGLRITGGDGGVSIISATVTIHNSEVFSNTAQGVGGGLAVTDNGALTLTGSKVMSNTAIAGGGLFVIRGDINLEGNIFSGNRAGEGGGLW